MSSPMDYLQSRGRLALFAGLLGIACGLSASGAREPGAPGLLAVLGTEADAEVSEFAWEPERNVVSEFVLGRPILFTGRRPGDRYAELFRAFVRLSPEGRVLGVHRVRNLSQTDLAHEGGLRSHGQHAVVVSESESGGATLSVLDLGGERRSEEGFIGAIELGLGRYLEQGSVRGLGQCDVLLPSGLDELALHQREGALEVRLDGEQVELELTDLFDPNSTRTSELDVLRRVHRSPPLGHFAADLGRSLFGPALVARVEELALSVIDRFSRTGYRLTHWAAPQPPPKIERRPPAPAQAAAEGATWPPPDLASPWPKPEPGEGRWTGFGADYLPTAAAKSTPSPLQVTFVRPDPERPYAKAHLVAIDTARLELGLRAGHEDPRPRTGPPGSGHVPEDPSSYSRIVATFNGAFKTTHGSYGMKAEGRVLVPPTAGAATLRIDPGGSVGLGTYRPEQAQTMAAMQLETAEAYRQNLDLLLEDARLLPTGRLDWGDHLVGSGVVAERSGLCVRGDGHLVYVWSQEATARTLARAMQLAGCLRGMHLDMNPGHCTFAAHRIESFQPLRASGRLLSPEMRSSATRYLRWSPKDFFFLAYRDPFPQSEAARQFSLSAAPGEQPAPHDLPAFILGQRTVAGLQLQVERADLSRARVRLSVGSGETATERGVIPADGTPVSAAAPSSAPAPGLAAWTIGHSTHGNRPGLSQGATAIVPMDRAYATLVLPAEGNALVKLPGDPLEPAEGRDLVQLELLARDGALLDHGRRITTRREHGALCIDEAGYLWLGRLTHDTPGPLAQALLDLGCLHVLEADRGSQSPAVVERAGHEGGLRAERAESALVAMPRAAGGRAYAF